MKRECYSCPIAEEGVLCRMPSNRHCQKHVAEYAAEREAIRARIKIRTEHVYPPIPVREWDWSAVDDNTYEPGCPIGWGRTEKAAIENLIDEIQLNT
jgi:hypothetical protein